MSDATTILSRIAAGDAKAADELLPIVYNELRQLASRRLANDPAGQSWQTTELVHEAERDRDVCLVTWYDIDMSIDPSEIELTPEQRRYVAQRGEETGMPWPEILNKLLPALISANNANGESAFDVATRLGLIGVCNDGPSDLAANPVHMEGFGESDNDTSSD